MFRVLCTILFVQRIRKLSGRPQPGQTELNRTERPPACLAHQIRSAARGSDLWDPVREYFVFANIFPIREYGIFFFPIRE